MKRLVVINIILIVLVSIIPTRTEVILNEVTSKSVVQEEVKEITSRSSDEPRVNEVEETVKAVNLNLTVESDLRTLSNLTADKYNKMLEGTNLAGLGESLEQAEKEHGVNGLYLMGLACLESAYRKI